MRKARNRKERCGQVLNWLLDEHKCGRPVRVRWTKWTGKLSKELYGSTVRNGHELVITLNSGMCRDRFISVDTLLHEYAHCLDWNLSAVEDRSDIDNHNSAYWCCYGVLYSSFHLEGGATSAEEYDF